MARIDGRAIVVGAAVALGVLVVTVAAFALVDRTAGIGWQSNWVFLFYAVAFAGLAAGGWTAARRRPDRALAHGVLAALAGYAVVAIVDVVAAIARGDAADPVALGFNALMAASAGTLGTLIAERGTRSGRRGSAPLAP